MVERREREREHELILNILVLVRQFREISEPRKVRSWKSDKRALADSNFSSVVKVKMT